MDWGSVADWIGGLGGAASAGAATTFYLMDRRRYRNEMKASANVVAANKLVIQDEARKTVADSLQSLSQIEESNGVSESAWEYHNGILSNHQARLRELAAAASGDVALQLAIGKAAHSLSFSNLPLEHVTLWFENVAVAEGELQAAVEMLNSGPPAAYSRR